jgi:PKD repeat protein
MRVSPWLLVPPAMTIALTATVVVAIAIILFAANITIINAQQLTNQPPAVTQNGTTLFQSTEDSFRLHVPRGWIIHDVNNTGSILSEESTQGYGILAQLCPAEEEQEQQPPALSNVSNSSDTASCQGSEGDIIHIVRYPDLETRLQVPNNITTTNNNNMTIDNILSYHMQKLEEVGYSRIEIVDSTNTTLNVTNAQTNQTIATVPAKNVEMTYNTNSTPNETRIGYFILTATDATAPNRGMTKGYSIFYESNSTATSETTTTSPSGSLAPRPLPAPVRQVFDSFELVTVVPTELPLTVEIISSDTEGVAPAAFDFEANVAGGTEPYTYSWDFDDGSEDSNEETVTHTFDEAGSYDVALTITDSNGRTASDSIEITVTEAAAPVADEEVVEEEEEVEEPAAGTEEVEVEEEVQPPVADEEDDIEEDIEDDVDAFIDDLLDRFGLDN